jgi:hydrogenase maturation protein HypF
MHRGDDQSVPEQTQVTARPRGEQIRVRGLVQGVGFRPTVWRLARDLHLAGSVRNDGDGVLIRVWGEPARIDALCLRLRQECPPLARIDALERAPCEEATDTEDFTIIASAATAVHTGIVPDAATCPACSAEILDPNNRRFRYPFTNCTHCGPRLSIVRSIPYDRANTSMSAFPMCEACAAEYADPANRRFHAQPNACPVCGPRVWLQDADGAEVDPAGQGDSVAAASALIAAGRIVAIKGIGGFHLACDAANTSAVGELRRRKRRWAKPFALMARDLDVIRRYARVGTDEAALLTAPAAPILLLDLRPVDPGVPALAPDVAPGQSTLGFMLPYSPLHQLLLCDWERPLVMTSGNLSDEPQCTDNADCGRRLAPLADAFLLHDREIPNRVDDSVVRRMDGEPRLLRRARGYAPAPLPLPPSFRDAPPILALGGELKSTICLLRDAQAVLSQHLGDLEEASTLREFQRTIGLYRSLFEHRPEVIAVDLHPNYQASRIGRQLADAEGLALVAVQHHRAHVASVLADANWPEDGGPVVGVALDGSGYGDDGTIWGGEWLVGGYADQRRVAHLRAVPLVGGTRAILEPWRCLYAHIAECLGWDAFEDRFGGLALARDLRQRPVTLLQQMIERRLNTPMTSSCGRLFDAVAAAVGVCPARIVYEGQAAIELEALCEPLPDTGYPFGSFDADGVGVLDPAPMWQALFEDLARSAPAGIIAARFHAGLADAVVARTLQLAGDEGIGTAALSGGVLQNKTLFERIAVGLRAQGLNVLSHRRVPTNDGGLSLGQAAASAVLLRR